MPRFAANLSFMFTEWAFLDRFAAAADAGFTAVEYLFPYEYPAEVLAEKLARHDLTQALFNLPPGDWAKGERGLAALPSRRDEFDAALDQALSYAKVLGAKRLHMMAGLASPDDPAARNAYRDALAAACDRAPADMVILVEPINSRDMPGYFLDRFDVAIDIVAALNRPNLRLQFDIYHRQIIQGDVLTGLRDLMPVIGHVQIASVPARNEPGSGELADFAILRALDDLGYEGYVGLEYRPAHGTLAGLGWLERFRNGCRY